jgi:hypothetical protein
LYSELACQEKVDMTISRRIAYVLAAVTLLVLPTALGAAGPPNAAGALGTSHASLKAYPGAVVSLKNPKTGELFYVESNGRRLVSFDKNGSVAWSVDVLDSLKNTPIVGQPVIRHLKLDRDRLTLTIGKHAYAEVEPATGNVSYLGAD